MWIQTLSRQSHHVIMHMLYQHDKSVRQFEVKPLRTTVTAISDSSHKPQAKRSSLDVRNCPQFRGFQPLLLAWQCAKWHGKPEAFPESNQGLVGLLVENLPQNHFRLSYIQYNIAWLFISIWRVIGQQSTCAYARWLADFDSTFFYAVLFPSWVVAVGKIVRLLIAPPRMVSGCWY